MRQRRPAPKITPAQVLVAAVVLGLFIAGVVIRGMVGALLVGIPAAAAGALLIVRWATLDRRIRVIRTVTVLACLAVAVSLAVRR